VNYAADEINVGDLKPAHFGDPQSGERTEQHGHPQVIGHRIMYRPNLFCGGHIHFRLTHRR